MTSEHLFKLIGSIDDEKIVDAMKQKKKYVSFCRYSGVAVMAACMLLIVTATFPSSKDEYKAMGPAVNIQENNQIKQPEDTVVGTSGISEAEEVKDKNYSNTASDGVFTPENAFNVQDSTQEFTTADIKKVENEYQVILENSDKKIYITEFTDDKYVLTDNEKIDDVLIYYSEKDDISITFCMNDLWYNLVFNNFTKEESFEYTADFIKKLQ